MKCGPMWRSVPRVVAGLRAVRVHGGAVPSRIRGNSKYLPTFPSATIAGHSVSLRRYMILWENK
jgi:hypothetical protein